MKPTQPGHDGPGVPENVNKEEREDVRCQVYVAQLLLRWREAVIVTCAEAEIFILSGRERSWVVKQRIR